MAGDMDIKAHTRTYGSVIDMMKKGTIACIIVAAFVIWLIV